MAKYKVAVNRISFASEDMYVEAESKAEAERLALEGAGSIFFGEHDAEYEVEGAELVKEFPCDQCGAPFSMDDVGDAHHVGGDGEVDHDADADHVPYSTEVEPA